MRRTSLRRKNSPTIDEPDLPAAMIRMPIGPRASTPGDPPVTCVTSVAPSSTADAMAAMPTNEAICRVFIALLEVHP